MLLFAYLLISSAHSDIHHEHHLDIDARAWEYGALPQTKDNRSYLNDPFMEIIRIGGRNLEWRELVLKNLNSFASYELPQRSTTPSSPSAVFAWGPETILDDYSNLTERMSKEMWVILSGEGELPDSPPIFISEFISYSLQFEKIYEKAARWISHRDRLNAYEERARHDIRSYYFLNQEPDLIDKLKNWQELSEQKQAELKKWMIGQCFNSGQAESQCSDEFTESMRKFKNAVPFYRQYQGVARENYLGFFQVKNPNHHLLWSKDDIHRAILRFKRPEDSDTEEWLIKNIEEEWQYQDWSIRLQFEVPGVFLRLPEIRFRPGVVDHVNGVGGNIIVMDSNRPKHSMDSSWIIRHELGHVLGLPDCYMEFYDKSSRLMTYYSIDESNLMCARGGKFKKIHYLSLRQAYLIGQ